MPIRSGSPGRARSRRGRSVWPCGSPSMKCGGMVAFRHVLRRRTADARVRRAAGPARRAAGRTGRRAPCAASVGGLVAQLRQLERHRRDVAGSSASSRCAAVAEPVIVVYTTRQRGVLGRQAAGARRPRPPPPAGAASAPSASQSPAGHTRRASRSSPRPCARDACRAAGAGVRASVSRSASATDSAAGVHRRGDATPSPVRGCGCGGAGTPAASTRSTTSPLVTASSTPPECTCPPVGSRESAQ